MATSRAVVDERGFGALRRLRQAESDISLPVFKAIVREQFYMLLIDEEHALAAIPSMLPTDAGTRRKVFELITQVLSARGEYSVEDSERIQRVAQVRHRGAADRGSEAGAPAACTRRGGVRSSGLVHGASQHAR